MKWWLFRVTTDQGVCTPDVQAKDLESAEVAMAQWLIRKGLKAEPGWELLGTSDV